MARIIRDWNPDDYRILYTSTTGVECILEHKKTGLAVIHEYNKSYIEVAPCDFTYKGEFYCSAQCVEDGGVWNAVPPEWY